MPESEIVGLRQATLGTWSQLGQTYSGRSAKDAIRPESQAAPPRTFSLLERLSLPSHYSADRRSRPLCDFLYFRVRAAIFDHTVRGALSPPHTSRRWDRQLGDKPETDTRGLRQATLRTRGSFGKPIQEGVPGLQRGPKAKLARPTNSIFRDDCHLPAMIRLTGGHTRSVTS